MEDRLNEKIVDVGWPPHESGGPRPEFGARGPPKLAQLAPLIRNSDGAVRLNMDDQMIEFIARLKAADLHPRQKDMRCNISVGIGK